MAPKEYIPLEAEEQRVLMSWAELESNRKHPELHWLYHVPNGGLRNKATAGKMRAEGVKSGVPDLVLPVSRGGYHGMYVELKRRKGGRLSDDQREWIDFLESQGYRACVCAGWEAAKTCLLAYLDGEVCRDGQQ